MKKPEGLVITKYSLRIDQPISGIRPIDQHPVSITKKAKPGFLIVILLLLTIISINAYFATDNQNHKIDSVNNKPG